MTNTAHISPVIIG